MVEIAEHGPTERKDAIELYELTHTGGGINWGYTGSGGHAGGATRPTQSCPRCC